MIVGIIGIDNDLTVSMVAEHPPVRVPTGRFKITILDQLLPRAIRIANDAYIINEHLGRIEQAEPEFIPKGGAKLLASHHAIGHRLPDASAALVAIGPGVWVIVVRAWINQFETGPPAVAPSVRVNSNRIDRIAR